MFTQTDLELLARIHAQFPQFEKLLTRLWQEEISDLPNVDLDKVQKCQGRVLAYQHILDTYRHAAGIKADRTAKPQL